MTEGGFTVVYAGTDLLVAELPGQRAETHALWRLEELGLRYPVYLELLTPPDDADLSDLASVAEKVGFATVAADLTQLRAPESRNGIEISPELRRLAASRHLRLLPDYNDPSRLHVAGATRPSEREIAAFEVRHDTAHLRLSDAGRRAAAQWPEGAMVALVARARVPGGRPDRVMAVADPAAALVGSELRFRGSEDVLTHLAYLRFVPSELGGQAELGSVERVPPTLSDARAWAARGLFGALVGLLGFAVLAIGVRRSRPIDPLVDRSSAPARRGALVLSAGPAIAIIALASAPLVTGPFASALDAALGGTWRETTLFGLGMALLAGGFALSQLASFVVPRWRQALIADPSGGRRPIHRGLIATGLLAAAVAVAAQFDYAINILVSGWPGTSAALYVICAALAVTVVVVAGRRALGGAWLCLILGGLVGAATWVGTGLAAAQQEVFWGAMGGGTAGLFIAVAVAVVAITWRVLSIRSGDLAAPLRAPIGGLVPLAVALGVLEIAYQLELFDLERTIASWFLALVALAVPVWGLLAAIELRPLRALGTARIVNGATSRRAKILGLSASAAFLVAVAAVESLARSVPVAAFGLIAALGTAATIDLVAELRARWRRPQLAPAWDLHHPQLAEMVARALDGQGLDVHLRAANLRICLGILGAMVPITVMVDRDRIAEAREIIGALLGCGEAADQVSGAV